MAQQQLPGFDLNPMTALGPNDPDDGDEGRQRRGLAIAALVRIEKNRLGYKVPSQSGRGSYIVNTDGEPFCTCPDFEKRRRPCKHIAAIEYVIQREEREDGTTIETRAARVTYSQDWPAYNAAQEHEQEHFTHLLRDLCDTIALPPTKTTGRPRLPLPDAVFAAGLKVYGTQSTRRAMTDMRNAQSAGLLCKTPSTATIWRCMEDPDLAPTLRGLIELSASPLASVEDSFAIDSTGFASSIYHRWFDHKWNKTIKESQWIKAHAMCGVQTNIITAADATANKSADLPYLPPFTETTAQRFTVNEVSADKAYLGRKSLHAVDAVGGTAFIPFKTNSKAITHHRRDTLWERAYHFYNLHREEFLAHYHKRSNVETTFFMVKSKFGASVRSKMPAAQINEVLLKFLCHNIVVLVQSAYELGVQPIFTVGGLSATKPLPAATKLTWNRGF